MKRKPYYLEIYFYLKWQFYEGTLKSGDRLPTVEQLCTQFAVSPNTIRTVLHKLSEEGVISIGRGKDTVVALPDGEKRKAIELLYSRLNEFSMVFDLFILLVPSFLNYSILQMSKEEKLELIPLVEKLENSVNDFKLFHKIDEMIRNKILWQCKNFLMFEMIHEIANYISMFYMRFQALKEEIKLQIERIHQQYSEKLKKAIRKAVEGEEMDFKGQISECLKQQKMELIKMVQFFAQKYEIKEQRTQEAFMEEYHYLYDKIVSVTIDRFYEGVYKNGDYLPSENKICEQYQVSLPTVKKAYKTLAQLGIAKTMNGKGTQLIMFSETPSENIFMNLEIMTHLTAFLEALQLIMLVAKEVSIFIGKQMDRIKINALERKIIELRMRKQAEKIHFVPIFIFEFIKLANYPVLELFYHEIKKKLIWGLYFDRFFGNQEKELEYRYLLCLEALADLKERKIDEFAEKIEKTMKHCYDQYMQYFNEKICQS